MRFTSYPLYILNIPIKLTLDNKDNTLKEVQISEDTKTAMQTVARYFPLGQHVQHRVLVITVFYYFYS